MAKQSTAGACSNASNCGLRVEVPRAEDSRTLIPARDNLPTLDGRRSYVGNSECSSVRCQSRSSLLLDERAFLLRDLRSAALTRDACGRLKSGDGRPSVSPN